MDLHLYKAFGFSYGLVAWMNICLYTSKKWRYHMAVCKVAFRTSKSVRYVTPILPTHLQFSVEPTEMRASIFLKLQEWFKF